MISATVSRKLGLYREGHNQLSYLLCPALYVKSQTLSDQ